MRIPTDELTEALLSKGIQRDTSPLFGDAGYREKNGGWVVIQESYTWQDTEHVIEDCVANECYEMAAIVKRLVEDKQKPKK